MLRIDYAGIAALISTSFYPPVYYSFMCNPFFCNIYLGFITTLGIAMIVVSLFPVFQRPEFRVIRASLFFGMGVSGVIPVLHKLIVFSHRPEALHTTGYEILMGLLYGLGALVYATRIPERWMPGKFDIAGHSHQLFHVTTDGQEVTLLLGDDLATRRIPILLPGLSVPRLDRSRRTASLADLLSRFTTSAPHISKEETPGGTCTFGNEPIGPTHQSMVLMTLSWMIEDRVTTSR
ncbi:hypothetical protein GW17_00045320 [Ensete ventricosum]|nr:hypothetical protein GW17_00045320 [Ensete ventricosum]